MAQSTISNTIINPNGQVVPGVSVVVTLMPTAGFRIAEATEVARSVSTTTDVNGLWSMALEQNINITPANTTYEVVEYIPQSQGGPRVWTITVGASNQTVLAALTLSPPAATQSSFLTQASADARYQALGGLGSGTPSTVSLDGTGTGSAGVSTSASKADHTHVAAEAVWTSYTPTLTQGVTLTKTATYAKYQRTGRLITVVVNLLITSSGTAANSVIVGLPVAAANAAAIVGSFRYLQTGTALWSGTCFGTSTTTVELVSTNTTASLGQSPAVTAANTHTVQIAVSYEAAT